MTRSIRARFTTSVVLAVLASVLFPSRLLGQQATPGAGSPVELSAGGGWGSLWDDETMLGRGVAVRGGFGYLFAERLLVSGDIDWMSHTRDSGYLAAAGDVLGVFARATYLFRADPAVRPGL